MRATDAAASPAVARLRPLRLGGRVADLPAAWGRLMERTAAAGGLLLRRAATSVRRPADARGRRRAAALTRKLARHGVPAEQIARRTGLSRDAVALLLHTAAASAPRRRPAAAVRQVARRILPGAAHLSGAGRLDARAASPATSPQSSAGKRFAEYVARAWNAAYALPSTGTSPQANPQQSQP